MSYGNALQNWQGTNPQGWAGTIISKSMIQTRILQLAIPSTATQSQIISLQKIQSSLLKLGILFQTVSIK